MYGANGGGQGYGGYGGGGTGGGGAGRGYGGGGGAGGPAAVAGGQSKSLSEVYRAGKLFLGGLDHGTTKESLEAYCQQW